MNDGRKLDLTILREYDIRGVVEETLNAEEVKMIGHAFGSIVVDQMLSELTPSVAVGYDGRLSSLEFSNSVCAGLEAAGVDVVNIGCGPTPMLYYATHQLSSDAGVMITGSHNPPNFNGIKMVLSGKPFFGADIQRLGRKIEIADFHHGLGSTKTCNVKLSYIKRLLQDFSGVKELSVAWDPGNGAMGKVTREISEKLINSENFIINEEVDGNFPNHHPDPTVPKNMVQLISAVKENDCDIGLAFDGDGDRLGVVDNLGNIVWADQYMLLLCNEIANLYDNPKIIMDVKCSKVFFDEAKKINCDPVMSRTGHSPIKEKMKELKSPLSGEMSGHVCYGDDFYGYDDAMYVGLRLLRILSSQNKSLSDLISIYPKTFSTPETRFDVDESRKFIIIDEVKERLQKEDKKIIDIDGVRVENEDGWFLMRASNTQNQLTCRAESISQEGLSKLIEIIENQLSLSGVSYKFTI